MGTIIQKLIALALPAVGAYAANWLVAHTGICPTDNATFCQFWPSLAGALLGGLGLLGIHPNGINGAPTAGVSVIGQVAQKLGAKFDSALDATVPQTGDAHNDAG